MTILFHPDAFASPPATALRSVRQLLIEARKAEEFGKPLAAALMQALARVLPGAGPVFERIEGWPGDLASDGVIFRLNAGLHALALMGRAGGLAALYGEGRQVPPRQLDTALTDVLTMEADALLGWLAHPTQTNEVARAAGLAAALLALGEEAALPCELLELGASAGLNLNLAHYAVRLGGVAACAATSTVTLAPDWRGAAVPAGVINIASARGVDLHPLDIGNPADRQSLAAYIWPGEAARAERLRAALAIAQHHPPQVEPGLASDWLNRQLAAPQAEGVRRVVFHSMVLQYASPAERSAIDAAFAAAATRASQRRPIARVSVEWSHDRRAVELRIARWDGAAHHGTPHLAAICHPYGEWIDWRGLPA
ncbi:DUF2332 family protein [Erythrobacter sp. BLCC-B19]|uniref:DUF2332 family protein n=1 Tax=Erythrobacter sp. BLCC-B19 TaxID=3025315 RepID=UPI0023606C7F|nr:DUF2332 family protein [Erythrobacter sp. BLCC-B19]WDA40187.1 DUF2332 family protein [Erythrobacter sp. BLCC-B19]